MNVRLTIWNKYDNIHSHVMDLEEALQRQEDAYCKPGHIKSVIQSETVTVGEAVNDD